MRARITVRAMRSTSCAGTFESFSNLKSAVRSSVPIALAVAAAPAKSRRVTSAAPRM
jgi:hypothetical protein